MDIIKVSCAINAYACSNDSSIYLKLFIILIYIFAQKGRAINEDQM